MTKYDGYHKHVIYVTVTVTQKNIKDSKIIILYYNLKISRLINKKNLILE